MKYFIPNPQKTLLLIIILFSSTDFYGQRQLVYMVNDINHSGSNIHPEHLIVYENKLFFSASDGSKGEELWSYYLNEHPTMVKDIEDGVFSSSPMDFIIFNNTLVFSASKRYTGRELWSSTNIFPNLISDIYDGYNSSNPGEFAVFNNKLYFSADDGVNGRRLWVYDGNNNPEMVTDYFQNYSRLSPKDLVVFKDKLYFTAESGKGGRVLCALRNGFFSSLYINSYENDYDPCFLTEFNNKLYFNAHDGNQDKELWFFDGVSIKIASDIVSGDGSSNPQNLKVCNNKLYFSAEDITYGRELWCYDDINDPYLVADIMPDTGSSSPDNFISYKNKLFFSAEAEYSDRELWCYDETEFPYQVADIYEGALGSNPEYLTIYKERLFFKAKDNIYGEDLWSYDDVNPPMRRTGSMGSTPEYLTVLNGKLHFITDHSNLMSKNSDKSVPEYHNMHSHIDWDEGTNKPNFTEFKGSIYFCADNGTNGRELWVYDGLNSGKMFFDINQGSSSSSPEFLKVFNNNLYFTADDGINGRELWIYNGSSAPYMISDIYSGENGSDPQDFISFKNKLYFSAENDSGGRELYSYDGLIPPKMEADIIVGAEGSSPSNFAVFNNKLYFSAKYGAIGTELLVYDGVNSPTIAANIRVGSQSSYPGNLTVFNDKLYFTALDDNQTKLLWRCSKDNILDKYNCISPKDLTVCNNKLFFTAENYLTGRELWSIDEINSPYVVKDINSGSDGSSPGFLEVFNHKLYFSADDGINGQELWVLYDGISVCDSYLSPSGKYTWTESGTYLDTLQNTSGGDSIVAVHLTVNKSKSDTLTKTVCDSYTSPSGKYIWTVSGVYTDTVSTSEGCNNILTINLTVNRKTYNSISEYACDRYTSPSGKYIWTLSGTYKDTIINSGGCDSILTINLTINSSTSHTIGENACHEYISPSKKYTWTTSGTYFDTIPNSIGCDSVIQINLDIRNTSSVIAESACYSYTSPSGKYIWTNSGTYMDTILNSARCDSVINIDLTINHDTHSIIYELVCDKYSSPSGKYTWTNSGMYKDTIPNSVGCDSIITVDLVILGKTSASIAHIVCDKFISPSGKVWTTTGNYVDTIPNSAGCDSIIDFSISILRSTTNSIYETACSRYISPSGKIWTESGSYTDTVPNSVGCDSIININLEILNSKSKMTAIACDEYESPSGRYYWNSSGTYFDTLQNSAGCDSIITIDLIINTTTYSTINPIVCDNYKSPSGRNTWTESGIYSDTISNKEGCDSIITIDLTLKRSTHSTINLIACGSYASPSGKNTWTESGIYLDTISNKAGCDSVITVDLTIKRSTKSTINPIACDSYTLPSGKNTWTESGIYLDTISNKAGCDSIISINLTINRNTYASINSFACDSYTAPSGKYLWTSSGTYSDTIPNKAGCDSIINVNLEIESVPLSITQSENMVIVNASSGATYQWLNCNNNFSKIEDAFNPKFTSREDGSFAAEVTQNECTDTTDCFSIKGSENPGTGIGENNLSKVFVLYPNPTQGEFVVELGQEYQEITVKIRNITGQTVSIHKYHKTDKLNCKLEGPSGLYLLDIYNNEKRAIIKIMKE